MCLGAFVKHVKEAKLGRKRIQSVNTKKKRKKKAEWKLTQTKRK